MLSKSFPTRRSADLRQRRRGHRDPQAVRMKLAPRLRRAAPGPPISVTRRQLGSEQERSVTVEGTPLRWQRRRIRSEEHTSELQSLMRITYAIFSFKQKKTTTHYPPALNRNTN